MGAVTGPFPKSENAYTRNIRTTMIQREIYKQGDPFEEKPLPYKALFVRGSLVGPQPVDVYATGPGRAAFNCYQSAWPTEMGEVYNAAYQKFVSKIHDVVSAGVFAAERREAASAIVTRALTLRKAWLALRKGRFREFLRTLDVPPKKAHRDLVRTRARQASGYWLEYWFGWSPMLQDIFAAVELLDSEYPSGVVRAASGASVSRSGSVFDPYEGKVICVIQADVQLVNPMLYRANQFGVLNPAVIAWELVPFSFLVDWFLPIGNYLASFSDFAGLELRNSFHTKVFKGKGSYCYPRQNRGGIDQTIADGFAMHRSIGVPAPKVVFALPERLSVTRAATAISLLVSLFIKPRGDFPQFLG